MLITIVLVNIAQPRAKIENIQSTPKGRKRYTKMLLLLTFGHNFQMFSYKFLMDFNGLKGCPNKPVYTCRGGVGKYQCEICDNAILKRA